jgi:ferritin-like metal-binding protein YciE
VSTARQSTASSRKPTKVAGEVEKKPVLDAALIAAAQAVEHYEMTRYGTLISWAKQLGHNEAATLLHQTLEEEKATDKKLTSMAEAQVNRRLQYRERTRQEAQASSWCLSGRPAENCRHGVVNH